MKFAFMCSCGLPRDSKSPLSGRCTAMAAYCTASASSPEYTLGGKSTKVCNQACSSSALRTPSTLAGMLVTGSDELKSPTLSSPSCCVSVSENTVEAVSSRPSSSRLRTIEPNERAGAFSNAGVITSTRRPRSAQPNSADPQNVPFQRESGILITESGGISVYRIAFATLMCLASKPVPFCRMAARSCRGRPSARFAMRAS
jgi:hypothetical protein